MKIDNGYVVILRKYKSNVELKEDFTDTVQKFSLSSQRLYTPSFTPTIMYRKDFVLRINNIPIRVDNPYKNYYDIIAIFDSYHSISNYIAHARSYGIADKIYISMGEVSYGGIYNTKSIEGDAYKRIKDLYNKNNIISIALSGNINKDILNKYDKIKKKINYDVLKELLRELYINETKFKGG